MQVAPVPMVVWRTALFRDLRKWVPIQRKPRGHRAKGEETGRRLKKGRGGTELRPHTTTPPPPNPQPKHPTQNKGKSPIRSTYLITWGESWAQQDTEAEENLAQKKQKHLEKKSGRLGDQGPSLNIVPDSNLFASNAVPSSIRLSGVVEGGGGFGRRERPQKDRVQVVI